MLFLCREGRRLLLSMPCRPIAAVPSASPLFTRDETLLGVQKISTQVGKYHTKSVEKVEKIIKAMKMDAASKLRAIQATTENSCRLWQPFTALLGDTPSVDVKKSAIVTISSDKCLCGEINPTSVKVSGALHRLTSGRLVRDSRKDIELCITELQKNPLNFSQVSVLADDILKNVKFDAVRTIFNKFQPTVSILPTVSTVLFPEIIEKEAESRGKFGELDSYEVEGSRTKGEILKNLAEFQFSCVMFNAVLENACSELAARMSAAEMLENACSEIGTRIEVLERACRDMEAKMSAKDSSTRNIGDRLDRFILSRDKIGAFFETLSSCLFGLFECISAAIAIVVSFYLLCLLVVYPLFMLISSISGESASKD